MKLVLGMTTKEWRRFLLWLLFGILLIFGSMWIMNYNKQNKKALEDHGEYTIATTLKRVWRVSRGKTDVQYFYFVNGVKYINWDNLPVINGQTIEVIVPEGKYMVKYLPENPEVSEIDFSKPEKKEIDKSEVREYKKKNFNIYK